METITVSINYDVKIPKKFQEASPEEILSWVEEEYSLKGERLLQNMDSELDTIEVTHIDDKEMGGIDTAYGQEVVEKRKSTYRLILDGQPNSYAIKKQI